MDETARLAESDATLVRAARSGDDHAFAVLVNRHRRLVFSMTLSVLKDQDDAEDATQESFVVAYRRLADLEDPQKFPSWLYSIALNVVRKWLRKRKLVDRGISRLTEDTGRATEYAALGTCAGHVGHLNQALSALSPADRTVVTLYYLVGLAQKRIAEILGIPTGTVKSRLHRSRKQLKRRLVTMSVERRAASSADYGRAMIAGMRGTIPWQKLLEDDGTDGWRTGASSKRPIEDGWERTRNAFVGEDADGTTPPLIIGDSCWRDFELSLLVTPISGGNAQVFFRLSEDEQSWYLFDFMLGWQAVQICKRDPNAMTKLSVVNFPIECGQEYDVQIAARGASLTSYVDGKLVNQVTDFSLESGAVALNVWHCRTAYRDPRVRFLGSPGILSPLAGVPEARRG